MNHRSSTLFSFLFVLLCCVEAFSPASYPTQSHHRSDLFLISKNGWFGCSLFPTLVPTTNGLQQIAQLVKENQRFAPLSMDEEEDDSPIDFVDEEPEEVDFILEEGELEEDDDEIGMEDDGEPPAWYTSQQRMQELREQYRLHEKDTGSPEYQVAGMTERIRYLTTHLQEHPKDFSTRRGLVALVNKRRRLLNYLARENVERYKSLIASLGIRHKAPGTVPSREEIYSRFPKQKAVKKHLVNKKK